MTVSKPRTIFGHTIHRTNRLFVGRLKNLKKHLCVTRHQKPWGRPRRGRSEANVAVVRGFCNCWSGKIMSPSCTRNGNRAKNIHKRPFTYAQEHKPADRGKRFVAWVVYRLTNLVAWPPNLPSSVWHRAIYFSDGDRAKSRVYQNIPRILSDLKEGIRRFPLRTRWGDLWSGGDEFHGPRVGGEKEAYAQNYISRWKPRLHLKGTIRFFFLLFFRK